jgi:hypothetical protein
MCNLCQLRFVRKMYLVDCCYSGAVEFEDND